MITWGNKRGFYTIYLENFNCFPTLTKPFRNENEKVEQFLWLLSLECYQTYCKYFLSVNVESFTNVFFGLILSLSFLNRQFQNI